MSQESLKKGSRPMGGRWLVAVMVFALGGALAGPSTASASTTPSPPAGGIRVLEPLPEPLDAQFTGGPVYVPPTAPPVTDVGATRIPSLAAPTYTCTGFGGIDGHRTMSGGPGREVRPGTAR